MSSYENYSEISRDYDETRVPAGIEFILGCLAMRGRSFDELAVLDAGCGTGNYAQALLEHVGRVEAVDLNEGMLEVARAKLDAEVTRGRIAFHHCSIDALPLADASVDGITINQVLHHVPDDAARDWPATRTIMREFARVACAGGCLTVNSCSHEQLRDGWWYAALVPEAVRRMQRKHVRLDRLETILQDSGFEIRGRFVPLDALMQGDHYFDAAGPTRAAWRHGDSLWAIVTPEELGGAIARIAELQERGGLDQFVRDNDARRLSIGQSTFVYAVKR